MSYIEIQTQSGQALSPLMLGTVQFGLPYGIANRTGQPSYGDVVEMVATAIQGGVNCLDTAAAYGESEQILGRVLGELKILDDVVVVTKTRPVPDESFEDMNEARQIIEASVESSRRHLGLDRLPLVLFHRERDIRFLEMALEMVDRGWVEKIGVSCGNEAGVAAYLLKEPAVSALQLPCNLLDRRHRDTDVMRRAPGTNTAIFLRSVFLQGLLVMDESSIPDHLVDVIPARRQFEAIAQQAGLTLGELAVRHALGMEGVTSVLVGVESLKQMRDNLELFGRGALSDDVQAAVDGIRPVISDRTITPGMWRT